MKTNYRKLIEQRARYLNREFSGHALHQQAHDPTVMSVTESVVGAAPEDSVKNIEADVGGEGDRDVSVSSFALEVGAKDLGATEAQTKQLNDESIVWAERPVLLVQNDMVDPAKTALPFWREQLEASSGKLPEVLRAVGRIEVANAPTLRAAGTGWLIAPEIVVTNRHVANQFSHLHRDQLVFRQGVGGRMEPRVDFVEEFEREVELEAPVVEVIWVAGEHDPDVAFLRIDRSNASISALPLTLEENGVKTGDVVAVIGYPVFAPDGMDRDLVKRVFGTVWEKKRFAPGFISGMRRNDVLHDCSTLNGNSGSPLVKLDSGTIVGLHYQGLFEVENRAVAAAEVWKLLTEVRRKSVTPKRSAKESRLRLTHELPNELIESAPASTVNLSIPVNVSINIGAGGTPVVSVSSYAKDPPSDELVDEADVVDELSIALESNAAVLGVEAGWNLEDGQLTDDRVLYVVVKESAERSASDAHEIFGVPRQYGGLPVVLLGAGPDDLRDEMKDMLGEAGAGPAQYQKPANLQLYEVEDDIFLFCHVSPDAGWDSLKDFIGRTKQSLTIGMYELTAPHVVEMLTDALKAPRTLELAIQGNSNIGQGSKKYDLDEEREVVPRLKLQLGDRFKYQWVPIGRRNGLVPYSYHIKVAVRDSDTVWLSSGSWQSSNQPDVSPAYEGSTSFEAADDYNREWNVILQHRGMAETLEKYIRWDMEQSRDLRGQVEGAFAVEDVIDEFARQRYRGNAKYFEPLKVSGRRIKVKPILTPDGYWEDVEALVLSATKTIYFQNQSLNLSKNGQSPHFRRLLDALRNRQEEGLDFRVIVRGEFFDAADLSRIRDYGFDLRDFRFQDRCHNKGIVVDGTSVLVGSHNWTNSGTAWNRDASLIIRDEEVAQYYQNIFLYDWENLATPRIRGRRGRTVRLESGAPLPSGFTRVPH